MIIGFSAFKYNEFYHDNYSREKIGLSLTDIKLNMNEIVKTDYLFVFSPTCNHCRKAIPELISLNKKYSLNLTGITSKSKTNEFKILSSEFDFNFSVIEIDESIFRNLGKIVPMIYEIDNDTIRDSFYPGDLKSKIISNKL